MKFQRISTTIVCPHVDGPRSLLPFADLLAFVVDARFAFDLGEGTRYVVSFVLTHIAELKHNGDVRNLSLSPFGNILAGGGADDTNGLVTHKTRKNKMKVDSGRYRQTRLASTREGCFFFSLHSAVQGVTFSL